MLVHTSRLPIRTEVEISWMTPPPEWVTLSSDNSLISDSGHVAAGALNQDNLRCCIATFAINLGICHITRAKLRGIVEGLQLACDMGYHRVRLELDLRCAILLLQSNNRIDHHHIAITDRF
ncbi:unnamed protein product [Linum trigynum]|uniref:RNase H type-1 domain-containing protein n=1 Tax=Linum trigynum TaxID=586398 RepID=A0AAV2GPM4_9ROSI